MARARRELAIAERPHFAAQGLLGDGHAVLVPEPLDQIDQPPAHHPMHRWNGTGLDHLRQMPAMIIGEARGLARRLAVDQAFRPLSVELEHPVAHDLQRHPADPRRLRARASIVDRRQRKQPAGLRTILGLASKRTQLRRGEVRAEGDRHGTLPWFTKLNHTCHRPGNHERVSSLGNWYKGRTVRTRRHTLTPGSECVSIRGSRLRR